MVNVRCEISPNGPKIRQYKYTLLNIDSSASCAPQRFFPACPPSLAPAPGRPWLLRVGVTVHLLVCHRAPLVF